MKHDTGAAQGGEDRPERIRRLRDEIGRVIEREYALVGKYHELAASLEAIIPDQKLRHDAVLQALSTTMKLDRQEVAEAFLRQQEELAFLETAVGEIFSGLGAKRGRIHGTEEVSSERPSGVPVVPPYQQTASQKPCPKCGENIIFDRNTNNWKCNSCTYEEQAGEAKSAAQEQRQPVSSPAVAKMVLQKKCPMCGGQMNFHVQDETWLCYTCAHEEAPADTDQSKKEGKEKQANTTRPAPAPSFAVPLATMIADESRKSGAGGLAGKKKTCPVCKKKMDWHEHEKMWRCFFCKHKTRH